MPSLRQSQLKNLMLNYSTYVATPPAREHTEKQLSTYYMMLVIRAVLHVTLNLFTFAKKTSDKFKGFSSFQLPSSAIESELDRLLINDISMTGYSHYYYIIQQLYCNS